MSNSDIIVSSPIKSDEEHQSSKHVDCIYPRLIKQQSHLFNGVGLGVINNTLIIYRVCSYKYLGFILDDQLSFNKHNYTGTEK